MQCEVITFYRKFLIFLILIIKFEFSNGKRLNNRVQIFYVIFVYKRCVFALYTRLQTVYCQFKTRLLGRQKDH